jgi:uracil-DNA glycosylase
LSKVTNVIEQIGTRIVSCNKQCDGIECRQKEGYYPRLFFLEPNNSPEVEILIVGENPGSSSRLEREFYKVLGEQHQNKLATYEDCQIVWRAIAHEHPYYQRPKDLVKKLGLGEKGLLWAETVFCEKSRKTRGIPEQTLNSCREQFLRQIIETVVPPGKHIICLGREAYGSVEKLVDHQRTRWKVIGVHHPTGRSGFPNYFVRKRKRLTDRPIKDRVKHKFRKLEEQATYLQWFRPP